MAPLRGWAPRGERLYGQAPFEHWNTMTFVTALRADRVSAPWVIDGLINATSFLIYVQKVLVPELNPGDIVIMDNLGSHKAKAIRAATRKAGSRLLFLPQYPPILIRSRSSSQSSSTRCERHRPEPDRPSKTLSQLSFKLSHQQSVETISRKLDMNEPKIIPL